MTPEEINEALRRQYELGAGRDCDEIRRLSDLRLQTACDMQDGVNGYEQHTIWRIGERFNVSSERARQLLAMGRRRAGREKP